MSIVKRYLFYKRAFYICNILNVFFIAMGIVAFIHFSRNQDLSGLELGIVGGGTLLFGVLGPLVIYRQMKNAAVELRKDTERTVAQWVAGWLEAYRSGQDEGEEPTREPYFWLNAILMTVELFAEKSKHPVAKIVGEFAPLLKAELRKTKATPKRTHAESKANTSSRAANPNKVASPRRMRKTSDSE